MESMTIHKPVVFKSYFSLFFISNTTDMVNRVWSGGQKYGFFSFFLTILK